MVSCFNTISGCCFFSSVIGDSSSSPLFGYKYGLRARRDVSLGQPRAADLARRWRRGVAIARATYIGEPVRAHALATTMRQLLSKYGSGRRKRKPDKDWDGGWKTWKKEKIVESLSFKED
jgi:hypothetical protein